MDQEGIIKFRLNFTPSVPVPPDRLRVLNAWRTILFRLELIGQDPARYGGVDYGNVSERLDGGGDFPAFAITGTQTAHLPSLVAEHYAIVTQCDVQANSVTAGGPIPPSSESLTHYMVYRACPDVRFVFHVHSPAIWRSARRLRLPVTDARAAYGTPAMAQEVERLLAQGGLRERQVFAMGGHEDGIVSFGATAEDAGLPLAALLARALGG